MEQLVSLIEELELEKEKLLEQKEENLQQISDCDRKINHLKYVISSYNVGIKWKHQQIETYDRLSELIEKPCTMNLFSFHFYNEEDMHGDIIKRLKSEIKDIKASKKEVCVLLWFTRKKQRLLKENNKQLDLRISAIDEEIKSKSGNQFVKKIERRN